jgi:hypothetical protein
VTHRRLTGTKRKAPDARDVGGYEQYARDGEDHSNPEKPHYSLVSSQMGAPRLRPPEVDVNPPISPTYSYVSHMRIIRLPDHAASPTCAR